MKNTTEKEQETLRIFEKYGELLDEEEIVNLEADAPVIKTSPRVQQRIDDEKRKSEVLKNILSLIIQDVRQNRFYYYLYLTLVWIYSFIKHLEESIRFPVQFSVVCVFCILIISSSLRKSPYFSNMRRVSCSFSVLFFITICLL